ncbi:hypothetical protein [Salinicola rhizosphaerae]|uniref:Uncharacterized protein n=1 Tax=Salinicola rhizosphaerae TaxID=1443141 RepID=A0ABQ3DTL9_9GAMM|nr:hypothetical protein [Salinicola rhizosphaerae]GHB14307.1 hypothetical protein GCM10009038_10800 [Salinicola rhizosphaerae]
MMMHAIGNESMREPTTVDDRGCCEMTAINLLDDSVSTQKEVQERNVMQLYLLTVQVRALLDVACHQGQAEFLTERLRFHTESLQAQFGQLVDKHKAASFRSHFYRQQQQKFDAEIDKLIGALEALGRQYRADQGQESGTR